MQQMSAANDNLQQTISRKGREVVDIEEVDEDQQHIEMVIVTAMSLTE
jgi:hypothetical protein